MRPPPSIRGYGDAGAEQEQGGGFWYHDISHPAQPRNITQQTRDRRHEGYVAVGRVYGVQAAVVLDPQRPVPSEVSPDKPLSVRNIKPTNVAIPSFGLMVYKSVLLKNPWLFPNSGDEFAFVDEVD